MEEKEISLIELFSLCVRNGGKAIIAAIVLAVLLAGYQHYSQTKNAKNSTSAEDAAKAVLGVSSLDGIDDWRKKAEEKIEENYAAAMTDYNTKTASYEADIEYYKMLREELNGYLHESLEGNYVGENSPVANLSSSIISIDNKIATMEKSLADMVIPEKENIPEVSPVNPVSLKKTILWGVIGAFAGIILVGAVVFLRMLVSDRMECSFQLERDQKIAFLGSVMGKRGLFDRLADRINGERVWNDADTALSYIGGSAALRCKEDEQVLLLSTIIFDKATAENILGTLKREGLKVVFADDFRHDPKAVEELKKCDAVILAEKRGVSEMKTINEAVSLAKASEKQVRGFVMVNGK